MTTRSGWRPWKPWSTLTSIQSLKTMDGSPTSPTPQLGARDSDPALYLSRFRRHPYCHPTTPPSPPTSKLNSRHCEYIPRCLYARQVRCSGMSHSLAIFSFRRVVSLTNVGEHLLCRGALKSPSMWLNMIFFLLHFKFQLTDGNPPHTDPPYYMLNL